MLNLYFKLSDDYDKKIYMRTMKYMTTLDEKGNEHVEIYKPENFILIEEYFKKAEFIGQQATDSNNNNYNILYGTNTLFINYNSFDDSYELIKTMSLDGKLEFSNLKINNKIDANPTSIVRKMLKKQLNLLSNENGTKKYLKIKSKQLEKLGK